MSNSDWLPRFGTFTANPDVNGQFPSEILVVSPTPSSGDTRGEPDVTLTTATTDSITLISDRSFAPWTEEQVRNLNAYQISGWHPFTCGSLTCPSGTKRNTPLIATLEGWVCPSCDYKQDWAHDFMTKPGQPASPFNSSNAPAPQPVGDEEIKEAIQDLLLTYGEYCNSVREDRGHDYSEVKAAESELLALIEKRVAENTDDDLCIERDEALNLALKARETIARLRSESEEYRVNAIHFAEKADHLRAENQDLRDEIAQHVCPSQLTPDEVAWALSAIWDCEQPNSIALPAEVTLYRKLRALSVGTTNNKEG